MCHLLIAAPGLLDTVVRVRQPVSPARTSHTVIDLLGRHHHPARFPGANLCSTALAPCTSFLTDYSLGLLGLVRAAPNYIHELESGRSRMFDVCRDPAETRTSFRNLRRARPRTVAAFGVSASQVDHVLQDGDGSRNEKCEEACSSKTLSSARLRSTSSSVLRLAAAASPPGGALRSGAGAGSATTIHRRRPPPSSAAPPGLLSIICTPAGMTNSDASNDDGQCE